MSSLLISNVKYTPVQVYIWFICVYNSACYSHFSLFFKRMGWQMPENTSPDGTAAPRLLVVLRETLRVRHYSLRTEQQYVNWVRRFLRFHHHRHPREMGAAEVSGFLTHLAVDGQVSASTQNQALSALLFLYREVLQLSLPWLCSGALISASSKGVWTVRLSRAAQELPTKTKGRNLSGCGLHICGAIP
jgi:hypothetical protein